MLSNKAKARLILKKKLQHSNQLHAHNKLCPPGISNEMSLTVDYEDAEDMISMCFAGLLKLGFPDWGLPTPGTGLDY